MRNKVEGNLRWQQSSPRIFTQNIFVDHKIAVVLKGSVVLLAHINQSFKLLVIGRFRCR